MTRRPHLSVTPMGLAYVSGDCHDRDSAHHAENALRTIWANLDSAGLTATLHAERELPGPECVEVDFSDASGASAACFEPRCGGCPVVLGAGAWHVVADGQLPTVERVGVGGADTARRGHASSLVKRGSRGPRCQTPLPSCQ